jgi:hypothetical protein
MKKKEQENQAALLSSPLPLAGQPNLRKLLRLRQYVKTISGKNALPSRGSDISVGLAVVPCRRYPVRGASIVVPALKHAPTHADTASNRTFAEEISRCVGTLRSNRAGRRKNRKKIRIDYPRSLIGG